MLHVHVHIMSCTYYVLLILPKFNNNCFLVANIVNASAVMNEVKSYIQYTFMYYTIFDNWDSTTSL